MKELIPTKELNCYLNDLVNSAEKYPISIEYGKQNTERDEKEQWNINWIILYFRIQNIE